jgi:uncharacterized protein YceK
MKILIVLLMVGMLAGCSYSTRFQVGSYGAYHAASVTTHDDL